MNRQVKDMGGKRQNTKSQKPSEKRFKEVVTSFNFYREVMNVDANVGNKKY